MKQRNRLVINIKLNNVGDYSEIEPAVLSFKPSDTVQIKHLIELETTLNKMLGDSFKSFSVDAEPERLRER